MAEVREVCWRTRDCPEDISSTCRHAESDYDMCPTKCNFGTCDRKQHELTSDPELVFDPTVDRDQSLKQSCLYCTFFLKHGPRREVSST